MNLPPDLEDLITEFEISNMSDISDLLSIIRLNAPILREYDDIYLSVVFADLTRYPVALLSKWRTDNFPGFNIDYYNSLQRNMQTISRDSFIYKLVKERNLIVIDDIEEVRSSDIGDPFEKDYMLENGWKFSIFHTLFHGEIEYGYFAIFSMTRYLTEFEIDKITKFLSVMLPLLSEKLLPAAYRWKSEIYRQDIVELEKNLSDLVLGIREDGTVIRINEASSYYLKLPPDQILGKNLKEINKPLYDGIKKSISLNGQQPIAVEIEQPNGPPITLELQVWDSSLSTDEHIVCLAKDITLLRVYEQEIKKQINTKGRI